MPPIFCCWCHLGFVREHNFDIHDACRWVKSMALGANGCLFLAVVWWIWRWRLAKILGSERWNSSFVVNQVWYSFHDFQYSLLEQSHRCVLGRFAWRPPMTMEGWFKLNVDGSLHSDSDACGCCVLSEMIKETGCYARLYYI